jgi:membrane protein
MSHPSRLPRLTYVQMNLASAFDLLKRTATRWNDLSAPRLGAALAFYTLLSLAPLVILVVAICGLFLRQSTAQSELLAQATQLVGYSGAKALQMVVNHANPPSGGLIASVTAIVTLIVGASGVFVELRDSLNTIWDARPSANSVKVFITRRLMCFGMVLALGFLLLVSLLISAAIGVVERYFLNLLPAGTAIAGEIANVVVSLAAITILFALMFKYVPDVRIDWRDVWTGALVTAVLFTIGRALLAYYLATAGVGSTYGAAGSLVALVVWVYYSAQIFFFGAIFTRTYSELFGSRQAVQPVPLAAKSASGIK